MEERELGERWGSGGDGKGMKSRDHREERDDIVEGEGERGVV